MSVAIAGMHRSGTSMVTRLLNLCGVYLGDEKDIISDEHDNPEGFWENAKFQAINDEILTLFNGAWDLPPVFEANWELSADLNHTYQNAQRVIEEISRPFVWGWKDPRNSLTFPFWKKKIPDLKIVICLRNPLDVYRSLSRRGYASSVFSYHLWTEYNQRLIASTKPEERIITHYDCFFYDPQSELRRLANFLELDVSEQTIKIACQTILYNLRHSSSSSNDLFITNPAPQVLDLYRKLSLQAGQVYELCLSSNEREFLQQSHQDAETAKDSVIQKLSQNLQVVNAENSRLRAEIIKIREEKIREITKIREEKIRETTKIHEEKKIEIMKLEQEKQIEIAGIQGEKQIEITEIQGEKKALQDTINEIFASRSWRSILLFQKIKVFLIPQGSVQGKIFKTAYHLVSRKYRKDIFPVTEKEEISSLADPGNPKVDSDVSLAKIYADLIGMAKGKQKDQYVAISDDVFQINESWSKLIAFYLPQFHPIPENDEWWGTGFVEWTNVSKAVPQFVGHYQPHLPGELGFYDLRLPGILKRQIELARKYGIHGFAFHYYWFNGKRLLEKPLDLFLNSKENFPFCICWANENWTRHWDGQENEVLIEQDHSPESDLRFIQDIGPILKDERYIRINGRPLIIVYRANIIPDIKGTVQIWREYCKSIGIGNPYLVAAQTFWFEDPRQVDFDAAVEFPPHNVNMTNIRDSVEVCNPNYQGNIYDYREMVEKKIAMPKTDYKLFRTVFPGWDNEPRKPEEGNSFAFSTPALYKEWLFRMMEFTLHDPDPEKRLVFINAWNEWGEGAHLEPDRKYGYAYLQATRDAFTDLVKEISDRNSARNGVEP